MRYRSHAALGSYIIAVMRFDEMNYASLVSSSRTETRGTCWWECCVHKRHESWQSHWMLRQSKLGLSSEMSPAMINYLILSCRTAASFSLASLSPRTLSADFLFPPRFVYNQRSVGSTHSSHGNLSQASITSGDVLSGDEVDIALQQPAKISGSTDTQGSHAVVVVVVD